MMPDSTALILAGGESRRFRSNKALADWRGGPMIGSVAAALAGLFPVILVVARDPETYAFLRGPGLATVGDLWPETHSLGGLYSGLVRSPTEHAFACGCDMPFIRPELVRLLWESRRGYDAVVPCWAGETQPLCAVYSRRCLEPLAELALRERRFSLRAMLDRVRTRFVPEEELAAADPEGRTFLDIDTPEDYRRASAF